MSNSGPPRLRLRLGDRLRATLLINLVPLLILAVLAVLWWQGTIGFAVGRPQLLVFALAAVVMVAMAVLGWGLMPLLSWLRDSCRWRMRHHSTALWLLPWLVAWFVWAGALILGAVVMGALLIALATHAWQVLTG